MNPLQWYHHSRFLYTSIVPSHTENHIKIHQGCYLRKFCPNGQHLLAFSQDQHSLELFCYKGASSANHFYERGHYKYGHHPIDISESLFDVFFHHKTSITVTHSDDVLNRECSLFLSGGEEGERHDNNNLVIVASSSPIPDEPYPHMFETFRNNESLATNIRFVLENYTLYVVDLNGLGCVTDSWDFKCDKIFLSHNQGLSLVGTRLAVLSTKHQTIHMFEIVDGKFVSLCNIGRFCYPDDDLVFDTRLYATAVDSNVYASIYGNNDNYQPFLEKWIGSLKHRLLRFLKDKAESLTTPTNPTPLLEFYKRFDYFSGLRIWKMQLLDIRTLLLKYTTEDVVTLRVSDPISYPAFFVFYDIETTKILAVYENSSEEFLDIYENYAEFFRAPVSHPLSRDTNCVSNCPHFRSLHMKFKQTIINARHGGTNEAIKRLLVQVPVSSQSFSCSPYLDLGLFKYDDKWISSLERPKACGDAPVR